MNEYGMDVLIRNRRSRLLDILSPLPVHKEVTSMESIYPNHVTVKKSWSTDSPMAHSHTISQDNLKALVNSNFIITAIQASKEFGMLIEVHDVEITNMMQKREKKKNARR